MRLVDERHVALKIELMLWSNKMDLLALSNVRGKISCLYLFQYLFLV